MPLQIKHEDKDITVYTEEEFTTAVSGAKAGLLTEDDARKMADSAAAKARRDAESKLKELQDELAKAGNSTERITELEKQITEQAGKLTGSEKRLQGIKALAKQGVSIETAEFLITHPTFGDADFSSEEGVTKAIESAKAILPQVFESGSKPPTGPKGNGLGASPSENPGPAKPEGLKGALAAHYTQK